MTLDPFDSQETLWAMDWPAGLLFDLIDNMLCLTDVPIISGGVDGDLHVKPSPYLSGSLSPRGYGTGFLG